MLQLDIEEFISEIKKLGYAVKLDTNGSFPAKLKELAEKKLIDYAAMDIKNSPEKYSVTAGIDKVSWESVRESVDFLLEGSIDYEFRTTVVKEFHTVDDIRALAESIKGARRYFLQYFVDSGEVLTAGLHPVSREEMEKMREAASEFIASVKIRGG